MSDARDKAIDEATARILAELKRTSATLRLDALAVAIRAALDSGLVRHDLARHFIGRALPPAESVETEISDGEVDARLRLAKVEAELLDLRAERDRLTEQVRQVADVLVSLRRNAINSWMQAEKSAVDSPHRLAAVASKRAYDHAVDLLVAALPDVPTREPGDLETPKLAQWEADLLAEQAAHPERYCGRCSGENVICWVAPSPLWNAVMRGGSINGDEEYDGIVCPNCFAKEAQEKGIASHWRLYADRVHVELETVTPSGRLWDEATWMWADPRVNGEETRS